MKKIRDIDDYARDINTPDVLTEEDKKTLDRFRYREMFKIALAIGQSSSPDKVIEILDLIKKIKEAKDDLVIENEEYNILKKAIDDNVVRWPNIFYAQAVNKIRTVEDIEVK